LLSGYFPNPVDSKGIFQLANVLILRKHPTFYLREYACLGSQLKLRFIFRTGGWAVMGHRFNLFTTTALASANLMAVPALAADLRLPVKAAPVAAPFAWNGCYVGLNAGAVSVRTTQRIVLPDDPAVESSGTDTGFIGGGQAGCNYQGAQNWVFGIEGDINYVGAKHSLASAFRAYGNGEDAYGTGETRLNWLMTLRGRFGHTWNHSLLYVTGGLAAGAVKSSFSALVDNTDAFYGSYSAVRFGWVAGGGLEHAFTNKVSAKIEYLHFDLGEASYPVIGPSETWNATAKVNGDIVRVGFNVKISP
jgi:outer membrane immunogenic protein